MLTPHPATRQTAQRLHVTPPAHAAADDPLQALYDEVPALAELAELLGHGGIGGSSLSLVVAALMRMPPGYRAAAASALLAWLLRARRQRRAARDSVLPAIPALRGSDPMLTAIRVMAKVLLSTLLSLYLAASWSNEAAAWEATLQDAMDEISEAADVPSDPTEVLAHQHQQPATVNTSDEAHPLAQLVALEAERADTVQERSGAYARLAALVARSQATNLSVPLPDGMNVDLSVTDLDDFALEIDELELPLPPRM